MQLLAVRAAIAQAVARISPVMLSTALFERAIAWAATGPRATELEQARAEFERRTGPIVSGSEDYEARIAHFFECALCVPFSDQPALIARFAAQSVVSDSERVQLAGWLRSHRSLWRFEAIQGNVGLGLAHDRIGGTRVRFVVTGADRELRPEDCFDGRIVAVGRDLFLSPGRVFHPQAAQNALQTVLTDAEARGVLDAALLDPLLGMRARLVGFESIRAEHVYRLDAMDAQGLAAPWARPANRSPAQREHS